MHWTERASAADSNHLVEKRLWDAANQLWANAALKPSEYSPTVVMVSIAGSKHQPVVFPRTLSTIEVLVS